MKNITIILILIIFLLSCSEGIFDKSDTGDNKTTPTGTNPPVVIIPPDEEPTTDTATQNILFAVKIQDKLYFSDHDEMTLWNQGNINKAGPMLFSHESDLIQLDASGDELSRSEILDGPPSAIKQTDNGLFYCREMTAEESLDAGAQAKIHTVIYKDGNVIEPQWYFNQWGCNQIKSVGDDVFLYDHLNGIHVINGIYDNVALVVDNEFFTHDIDTTFGKIYFNGVLNYFGFNYATTAKQWILYEGLYYSENGYTWSESEDLQENQNSLFGFNSAPYPIDPQPETGQNPVFLKAGVFGGLLWWIECNTGLLFSFDASTDALSQKWKIFNGDGLRSTGILKRAELKPLIADDKLYFSNGGIFSINLNTGIINAFFGGSGELVRYE